MRVEPLVLNVLREVDMVSGVRVDGVETQILALHKHASQIGGLRGGPQVGDRLRERAESVAESYQFQYGQVYRRIIARR